MTNVNISHNFILKVAKLETNCQILQHCFLSWMRKQGNYQSETTLVYFIEVYTTSVSQWISIIRLLWTIRQAQWASPKIPSGVRGWSMGWSQTIPTQNNWNILYTAVCSSQLDYDQNFIYCWGKTCQNHAHNWTTFYSSEIYKSIRGKVHD